VVGTTALDVGTSQVYDTLLQLLIDN
jgi:hypothetical protein